MSDIDGFKVKFAQRGHSPPGRIWDHLHASMVVNQAASECNEDTFVAGDRGRKRFEQRYSTEDLHSKAKKTVPPPKSSTEEKRGKRCIPPKSCDDEQERTQRRHLEPLIPAVKNARGLPSADWNRKKAVLGPDGVPVSRAEPQQFNLESTMNRKQRLLTDIERRNHIPAAAPGDHSYKAADREPGFFAKGGLIPGSTNVLRESSKPTLRKSENDAAHTQGKPLEATFAKMLQKRELDYDLQQVLSLTVDSSRQNQRVPSWEERTGCWLVAPQDEAF